MQTKTLKPTAAEILSLTDQALNSSNRAEFLEGIRRGFDGLRAGLTDETRAAGTLDALSSVLDSSCAQVRQRQVLEICAWPIFDKPGLPVVTGTLPEFLWLFCVPFVVQFSQRSAQTPVALGAQAVDSGALVEALYTSASLNPRAVLSALPTLFTREDLQREGPAHLASGFVQAVSGAREPLLEPKGVTFDPEVECARVVTLYALGCARLPVGEKTLRQHTEPWDGAPMERLVAAGLTEQGLEVEGVTCLPPCSMAETVLRCTPVGMLELTKVLHLALHHYDLSGVYLEHPAPGWAELHATIRGEPDAISVLPAFSFAEPPGELEASVTQCCSDLGIPFQGAYSIALDASPMLH